MAMTALLATPARFGAKWLPLRAFMAALSTRGQDLPGARTPSHATMPATTEQIVAFENFFRRFEVQISSYLWRMTGDEQSAYDLSQETFLRAWEHFAAISAYPVPQSWLFRVATNLALHHLRRRAAPVGAAVPLPEGYEGVGIDPTAQLGERDLVLQTLLGMPVKLRAVLVLREVYGLSTAEAGRTLGLSLAASKKTLVRAHQQFRQSYLLKEGRA